MRECEIIKMQEDVENRELFLQRVGMFYQAYNEAAFAIHQITGYKIKKHERKNRRLVYILGFPTNLLDEVLDKIKESNGDFQYMDEERNLISFSGIEGVISDVVVDNNENKVLCMFNSLLSKLSHDEKVELIILLLKSLK